ncbi:GntR family transcriptional regulator [Kribbella capetownensis]|uniref:GntR family transcriptional regulator n=1 Tax=Kribbella capetownensis TaxID=1572659 RepID=A0A4R0JEJ4_9ACTN|nr:GntR family transcriptional regulator [Kribbella capetownensis]TCC44420.1 GntR family transcriptional regulator [Kribbella capetownensis]
MEEPTVAGPLDQLARQAERSPALWATVVPALRQMIVSGALAPGAHLPEGELAAALEMSRGPIREALIELEREGLVVLRRHRGAQVIALTDEDIEEIYTLRLSLEQLAITRALPRLTDEHLATMDDVLEQMRALGPDYEPQTALDLDFAFHDVLYQAAAHSRLDRAWQQIRSQVAMLLHSRHVARRDFHEIAYAEHKAIRDIITSGDTTAATEAINHHLTGAYHRLITARH